MKNFQVHPLYKKMKCLLFDGTQPFTDGIDQACSLTKAVKRLQFPDSLLSEVCFFPIFFCFIHFLNKFKQICFAIRLYFNLLLLNLFVKFFLFKFLFFVLFILQFFFAFYCWQLLEFKNKNLSLKIFFMKKCVVFQSSLNQSSIMIYRKMASCLFHQKFLNDRLQALLPKNLELQLRDFILHGERYDPSLERLPRLHDPILFWRKHPVMYGTPDIKKGFIFYRFFLIVLYSYLFKLKLK